MAEAALSGFGDDEAPGTRFAGLACAVLGFVLVALAVTHHVTADLDVRLELFVHGFASPLLDLWMRLATAMGTHLVAGYVGVASAIVCWRHGDRHAALRLVVATAGAMVLNHVLKVAFARERPMLFEVIVRPESYSFPSGHTAVSTAVYGALATSWAEHRPRHRVATYLLAALGVGLIALSRVYLGVHWPTDILGGALVGLAILAAFESLSGGRELGR